MATTAPPLLSAYLLTCKETCNIRASIIARLEAEISPETVNRRLEHVLEHDASDLSIPNALASIPIDTNPANLDDELIRPMMQQLHVRQLSNTLKHLAAIRRVSEAYAKGGDDGFALVVEDDAVFGDGMRSALRHAVSDAPNDADLIFVGLPSTRLPPVGETKSLFDDPMVLFPGQVIPACDSYIIRASVAKRLLDAWSPIRLTTTLQLSYLIRKKVIKAYVAVPNVFVDGSKVGVTTSSVDPNNLLIWNQAYCKAMDGFQKLSKEELDAIWESQPLKDHPDCLVQRADQLVSFNHVAEAQELYEKALAGYTASNCVVNTSSSFMMRYMSTYKE